MFAVERIKKIKEILYERKKVDENNRDWHLPIQILVDNIFKLELDKYIKNFSNQDRWSIIRKFLMRTEPIPENWYAIHWINEEWRRNKISKNIFKKESVIFKLFQKHEIRVQSAKPLSSLLINFQLSKIFFVAHLPSLKLLKRK